MQGTLAVNSNYAVTFIGANLTIVPRNISVTADSRTKNTAKRILNLLTGSSGESGQQRRCCEWSFKP
ncbi:MAG: hypothetical protein IPN67_20895 [Bacteroidales bacterium]|nr:hypothetical protein [Bacteroidales bacterium]